MKEYEAYKFSEKETNERRVLREFVEEFSPVGRGFTQGYTYNDLFEIISDIVDIHYGRDY